MLTLASLVMGNYVKKNDNSGWNSPYNTHPATATFLLLLFKLYNVQIAHYLE